MLEPKGTNKNNDNDNSGNNGNNGNNGWKPVRLIWVEREPGRSELQRERKKLGIQLAHKALEGP